MTEIAVLRQHVHGLPAETYAAELRTRLPDVDVRLARTPGEEQELLATAEIATGLQLSPAELEAAQNLELFACVYAGTGHLDLDAFRERDVAVTNGSGVHGPNIAEYVIGSMIVHARDFKQAWRQQKRREWRSFPTTEIHGSTVTVVGLGAIGEAVATRLEPFGAELLGVRYSPEKGGPTAEVYGFEEIYEPLSRSDYVVLACPLTETTENLIDEEALRTMPTDAVLINIARGGVVDTDALVRRLRVNGLGGVTLDVTDPEPLPEDHPLWSFGNVHITPHNAGYTPEYFSRVADILADNVARIHDDRNEDLRNQVA
ncbi:Phosphoglycerate dehydrogenase or related dehydrogenase [Halalkaliarchaeum sp. AArc-CO]|uniref:D-2-hydroxyacid dehydrogenase n=1 Tax=unclassified Halalkaliarchaeum TaxID=2678344 RepID=UPI00217EB684|nr:MULTISPECIES: D-2-hydroxyacid dehydrogenase [unclassified Halalkaliarchaeum]MDR5671919.1 D-2-hydroxyacid dehydrogenase [Halalkaliarchaeum sp. AArc-GB]UWG51423.1 Phosphoglycerate dehydrogenase or related dehydrogenase [Halalkaliarchaeum sp. AArc-CO]